jgi:caffeoyl-CoA O-methyltransferase
MTERASVNVTAELKRYIQDHSSPVDDVQRDLIDETYQSVGDAATMQIAPEQGVLLTMLTRLTKARSAVEVGTFTGYSSLCIARGLADGGRLLCCDVSEEWTSIARRYWARAGVADRIELRIGPAIDTLRELPAEATIDLAFIDADKPGYIGYWDELVPRVRPGGLVVADNVLWSGSVADPEASGANVEAIRAFNDHVAADDRVDVVVLPVSDGVTLARVR